jgi:hypothetical protein
MSMSQTTQVDWRTAEVAHGGTLTVELKGELPRGWRKRFAAVVALLDADTGRWGEVAVRKGRIVVANVREGAEPDLRHLLESALTQVDSDLGSGDDDDAADDEEDDAAAAAEARMTDTFRGFGSSAVGDA